LPRNVPEAEVMTSWRALRNAIACCAIEPWQLECQWVPEVEPCLVKLLKRTANNPKRNCRHNLML
jgi:hypothetical protein